MKMMMAGDVRVEAGGGCTLQRMVLASGEGGGGRSDDITVTSGSDKDV
jgi:hypothetical protein